MSEDIFVPLSKPEDAIVGPLDTITWLTNNSQDLEDILINGYQMTRNSWIKPKKDEQKILNNYLGLGSNLTWRMTNFYMEGEGANIKIRVIVRGVGKVRSQSVKPGRSVNDAPSITLVLG